MKTNTPKSNLPIDEQNDAIRAQVEREIPTPANFESDDARDEHRAEHEARFLELVKNPSLWMFS